MEQTDKPRSLKHHTNTKEFRNRPLKYNPLKKRDFSLIVDRIPECDLCYAHYTEKVLNKSLLKAVKLPNVVDLRARMPQVYDQGNLGSCTANALCGAIWYQVPKFSPSRLFLYYNERVIENTVNTDSGAYLSDGIKSLNSTGVCTEKLCPYVISKFRIRPSNDAYKNALLHKNKKTGGGNVPQTLTAMQQTLNTGIPFVIGFLVYSSFETITVVKTGIVPMPTRKDELLGGHAVLVVGYDNTKNWWICRNSWGKGWGAGGYFFMPYNYLLDPTLASDIWIVSY